MGSSFKPVIFEEHVQEGLLGWAQKARIKGKKPGTVLSRKKTAAPQQLECVFSIKDPVVDEDGAGIVELNGSMSRRDSSDGEGCCLVPHICGKTRDGRAGTTGT
ncbi:MLO-like protein 1 [Platanthera guangdongensis]|uniref:MLO-like protein 1 n=1 Tax=Platanthera guangdongensis TaxID=2320717 RepID=A0ABR2M439_9ASPA